MKSKYSVSDAEWEVLKMLWKQKEGMRQTQLLELFEKEGKEWKRQTLNTFLSRLEKKGLVTRDKGVVNVVYGEEEYNFRQMQEAINNLYGGKISNFVAAFTRKKAISKEDAAELKALLK